MQVVVLLFKFTAILVCMNIFENVHHITSCFKVFSALLFTVTNLLNICFVSNSLKSCEPEFLIATPERLLELVSMKAIDISHVSMLVCFLSNVPCREYVYIYLEY